MQQKRAPAAAGVSFQSLFVSLAYHEGTRYWAGVWTAYGCGLWEPRNSQLSLELGYRESNQL
jgi:hypothetical protein